MADYPITYKSGRGYYGPYLQKLQGDPDPYVWSGGPQQVPFPASTQAIGWGKFLTGTAAIAGAGFIPFSYKGQDRRVWDLYVRGIRGIEEYSPGKILRTFQASSILSQLETAGRATRVLTPAQLGQLAESPAGVAYLQYLNKLTGKNMLSSEIMSQGVRFEAGRLVTAQTGQVLLANASVLRTPARLVEGAHGPTTFIAGSLAFPEAYSRGIGVAPHPGMFAATPLSDPTHGDVWMVAGGQTRTEAAKRMALGYGEELVERFHRLIRAPAGMEPFATVFDKLRGWGLTLGVEPGVKFQTFGRLAYKYGILAPLGIAAYKWADWRVRNTNVLDETILSEGITPAIATVWAKGNLMYHKAAEGLGWYDYGRWQEEVAPGSTSLSRLAAFPIAGALLGGSAIYTRRMAEQFFLRRQGMDFAEASAEAYKRVHEFTGSTWFTKLGQAWEKRGAIRFLGKGTPGKLAALIGAGVGLLPTLPFLPGALAPSESSEELEALYSGEAEVPIRAGRWWEMGRCLIKSTTCKLLDGTEKRAEQVQVGDVLVGPNYQSARVLAVHKREISNQEVYLFSTAFDRSLSTGLTANHIVPVLRDSLQTVEAQEIKPGDFVEIPVPPRPAKVTSIDFVDIIRCPVFHKEDRICSVQKNWFTRRDQRSGPSSIPRTVDLDYDFGLLLGYFLAEGNISFHKETPAFIETVHALQEKSYTDDILRICKERFDTEGTIRFKTTGKKTKEGCWIVRICSSILAKAFRYLLYSESYSALDKHMPDFLLGGPDEFLEGVIDGYWRGDGHLDSNSRVISSSRKQLVEWTQKAGLYLDRPSGLSFEANNYLGKWRLRFSSSAACASLKILDGRLYARVKAIELQDYTGLVYDFEVDHPDHLYQAGTFLVHNSPWEGGRIQYYRPHWYRRMLDRSTDKGIWGALEEEGEELSPFQKWRIENTTYDLEKAHYYDRPYPQTGTFGEDIPLVGPLVAATIGRLIKPPLYMHTEEYLRTGEGAAASREDLADWNELQALHPPSGFGERRAPELGEVPPGMPISPYGFKGTVGEQFYRFTEQIGLPGFLFTALKEKVAGTPDLFDQEAQLESARRMYGSERSYWDLQLGGGAGCFTRGTLIKTPDGYKNIEDIEPEHYILSADGKERQVVDKITHKTNPAPILRLRVSGTGTDCFVTANHHIPAWKRPRYSHGHAKPLNKKHIQVKDYTLGELSIGDYLCYPILRGETEPTLDLSEYGSCSTKQFVYGMASKEWAACFEALEAKPDLNRDCLRLAGFSDSIAKEVLYQFRHHRPPCRWPRYVKVNPEVAYLIGWMIAEGSFEEKGKIVLTMHKKELPIAKQLSVTILANLNCVTSISIKEPNTLRLTFCIVPLARWARRALGHHARHKKVPHNLKISRMDIATKLLQGLIEGDGWLNKDKLKGGFTTTSLDLAYDVFDLALRLEIKGHLVLNYIEVPSGTYPQGTPRKTCKRHYIQFSNRASIMLGNIFYAWGGNVPSERRAFIHGGHLFSPITHIDTTTRLEPVYDLTIEGMHYYIVQGTIVHNTTELWRRLYPHRRRQIELYNPIRNTQPEWLPGPGERSPDFRSGDPFGKIPEGELRLPGPGYAARFPELEGVAPEDYPEIHRLKILSDVAPYSEQFENTLGRVRAMKKAGELSDYEESLYSQTMEQVQAKKRRKEFFEYKYRDRELPLAERRLLEAKGEPRPGLIGRLLGGAWESLGHNVETPLEHLTPISPMSKLVHMRTAIEDYERTQVFGTEAAFWQHPWAHFIRPTLTSAKAALGMDGVPEHIQARRELEEYFDILKYIKHNRLEGIARASDDTAAAKEFERVQGETLVGANPYSMNFASLFRALPRRERDYFNSFAAADLEERERISELVPDNEKRLYQGLWELRDAQNASKAMEKGLLADSEEEKAIEQVAETYTHARTEGFPVSEDLWSEYLATREKGETYVDWYRRTKIIQKRLAGKPLPGPDWVGWHPSVDLEDIKMKVVEQSAEDMHDYDLWPSRRAELPYRPYINKEAVDAIMDSDQVLDEAEINRRITEILGDLDMENIQVFTSPSNRDGDEIELHIQEDRTQQVIYELRGDLGMVR